MYTVVTSIQDGAGNVVHSHRTESVPDQDTAANLCEDTRLYAEAWWRNWKAGQEKKAKADREELPVPPSPAAFAERLAEKKPEASPPNA